MKKWFVVLILSILLLSSVSAFARENEMGDVLLVTVYRQMGNRECLELGVLDANGNCWTLTSDDPEEVPFDEAELAAWIESNPGFEPDGSIRKGALSDVKSLVATVEARPVVTESVADDAGTQTSFACSTGRDGIREIIVLGESGDSLYENTNPAAQSLYKTLRRLFPKVTAFTNDEMISPAGFQKTDILTFCGYAGIDLTRYTMTAYSNDCEAGASQTEPQLGAKDMMRMTVTGKQNSLFTTGNTVTYCFDDKNGSTVAAFEFYNGLLVCADGMYAVEY